MLNNKYLPYTYENVMTFICMHFGQFVFILNRLSFDRIIY